MKKIKNSYKKIKITQKRSRHAAAKSPGAPAPHPGSQYHRQFLQQRARDLVMTHLPPVLHHRLEPLAVCLPSVGAEFFRIARNLHLVQGAIYVSMYGLYAVSCMLLAVYIYSDRVR